MTDPLLHPPSCCRFCLPRYDLQTLDLLHLNCVPRATRQILDLCPPSPKPKRRLSRPSASSMAYSLASPLLDRLHITQPHRFLQSLHRIARGDEFLADETFVAD